MLDKVKQELRIKNKSLDEEVTDLIESALLDLKISGVKKINREDPLIIRAVKLYSKANFGLDNKDSEKYAKAYTMLKEHLSLCGDYNVE